jgi:predicted phosphodiesterase
MIKQFLKKLLRKPIGALADKYSSRPDKQRVFAALTDLYKSILTEGKKGSVIKITAQDKYIIFSDQHKGAKNGNDIFAFAENNYLAALRYYDENRFTYINLGDGEELWENGIVAVKKNNVPSFQTEKLFIARNAFIKIFGNHDLYWDNDPLAKINLKEIYGEAVSICEGAVLQTTVNGQNLNIFLTHGHQGDLQSDGNWFSKWFVANVWAPLQMYLELNLNTPSVDDHLKTVHNDMMYGWSAMQPNTLLITGHTHQAVFESLTHLERLYRELSSSRAKGDAAAVTSLQQQIKARVNNETLEPDFKGYKPTYFNSGCCCFDDGDITGIEIADGFIRLIKWEYDEKNNSTRAILEEITLIDLLNSVTL